jgi:LysM repeat protein/predicted esterase
VGLHGCDLATFAESDRVCYVEPTMRLVRSFPLWLATLLVVLLCITLAPVSFADGKTRTHQVAKGQTLGAIARRYHVTVEALCKANRIRRRDPIRPGQKLIIPSTDGKVDKKAAARPEEPAKDRKPDQARQSDTTLTGGQQTLEVPGAPPAYYYEPIGRGRLGLRPVIVVLHGRGGDASSFCKRWAPVARSLGWLVCPSGPADRGSGRTWNNDWGTGRRIVDATLQALRKKYGRRVQLYGNTLVGFSEGAFVAMNIGVREARTFNRWLILAADDGYWGAAAPGLLARARSRVRRVYLITGKQDSVHGGTMNTRALLRSAKIPVRISHPADMGHVVALESKPSMYRAALTWLSR